MGTFSKFVHRIKISENLFEIKHSIYNNGACQCFKDCDCYSKKDEFLGYDIRYSNGLVLSQNGKEMTYSSIDACKSSLKAYLTK